MGILVGADRERDLIGAAESYPVKFAAKAVRVFAYLSDGVASPFLVYSHCGCAGAEIAAEHDIKAVAKLPINPEAASKVDGGFAEDLDVSALDNIFEAIRNC